MGDGYDRYENEGSGGSSFVIGLLTGTVLGAGLGMLFAPKAGAELRGQLGEQAGNLANSASDGYRRASEAAGQGYRKASEAAGAWAERGRDMYGKAREAVSRGAEEAEKYVRDATSGSQPSTSASSSGASASGSASSYGSGGSGNSGPSYGSGPDGTHSYSGTSGSTGSTGPRRS